MNNVVLVGRLCDNPKIVKSETGKKLTYITIAVSRNYKNSDGIYETDFVSCILWNAIADTAAEYCHVGDVIGIKGRIQTSSYEDENNEKHYVTEIVAERLTFLSSSKPKENEEKKSSKKKKVDE